MPASRGITNSVCLLPPGTIWYVFRRQEHDFGISPPPSPCPRCLSAEHEIVSTRGSIFTLGHGETPIWLRAAQFRYVSARPGAAGSGRLYVRGRRSVLVPYVSDRRVRTGTCCNLGAFQILACPPGAGNEYGMFPLARHNSGTSRKWPIRPAPVSEARHNVGTSPPWPKFPREVAARVRNCSAATRGHGTNLVPPLLGREIPIQLTRH